MKYKEIKDENGKVIAANYYIEKDGVTYWEQIGETHAQFEARVNKTGYTAKKVKKIMQKQIDGTVSVFENNGYWHMTVCYTNHFAKPIPFWSVDHVNFAVNGINYSISKSDFEYYHKK